MIGLPASVRRAAALLALAACGCGVASGGDSSSGASNDGAQSGATAAATAGAASASSAAGAGDADAGSNADADAGPPGRPAGEIVLADEDLYPDTVEGQREALFRRMKASLGLTDEAMGKIEAIFAGSKLMGQGNPKKTTYPMTRKECREKRAAAGVVEYEYSVCGSPFMVPVFDPSVGETVKDTRLCIDEYEFPGIPCEHPVVWVSSREAEELCQAEGKRLCDAHEWEGACAGAVHAAETGYAFGKPRREMRRLHNQDREIIWSYGPAKDHDKCGTASKKNKGCTSSGYRSCGSNTYPAGSFPECKSPFGVYDLHGNAAEHMNFPMKPEQLGSRGGTGETEMKGSWFIFKSYEAHPDDCRWRAPDWHVTKLMDRNSHANYHLGFRCCKDVPASGEAPSAPAPPTPAAP
ncbi:MAG: SUMF1/EgtB/PvdO family nonheme iron enzyme [Polyangiaceae bacterium]